MRASARLPQPGARSRFGRDVDEDEIGVEVAEALRVGAPLRRPGEAEREQQQRGEQERRRAAPRGPAPGHRREEMSVRRARPVAKAPARAARPQRGESQHRGAAAASRQGPHQRTNRRGRSSGRPRACASAAKTRKDAAAGHGQSSRRSIAAAKPRPRPRPAPRWRARPRRARRWSGRGRRARRRSPEPLQRGVVDRVAKPVEGLFVENAHADRVDAHAKLARVGRATPSGSVVPASLAPSTEAPRCARARRGREPLEREARPLIADGGRMADEPGAEPRAARERRRRRRS